jgi:hypothetical protein
MRRALALAAVITVASACGPRAKPAEPVAPVTRPVTAIADLHGSWEAADIDGWRYELDLDGDAFAQSILRTSGGACAQRGKVQSFEALYGQPYNPVNFGGKPESDAGAYAFVVQLEENECNRDYQGAQLVTLAVEFTGDAVTLRTMVGWGGPQETRRYTRVQATAPPP